MLYIYICIYIYHRYHVYIHRYPPKVRPGPLLRVAAFFTPLEIKLNSIYSGEIIFYIYPVNYIYSGEIKFW